MLRRLDLCQSGFCPRLRGVYVRVYVLQPASTADYQPRKRARACARLRSALTGLQREHDTLGAKNKQLSAQVAELIGHQNHKQKIHHT
eukprot:7384140-Prymnesium_polylepis.3